MPLRRKELPCLREYEEDILLRIQNNKGTNIMKTENNARHINSKFEDQI